jgi:hypothetical protein
MQPYYDHNTPATDYENKTDELFPLDGQALWNIFAPYDYCEAITSQK